MSVLEPNPGHPPLGELPSLGGNPPLGANPSLGLNPSLGSNPSLGENPPLGANPALEGHPSLGTNPQIVSPLPLLDSESSRPSAPESIPDSHLNQKEGAVLPPSGEKQSSPPDPKSRHVLKGSSPPPERGQPKTPTAHKHVCAEGIYTSDELQFITLDDGTLVVTLPDRNIQRFLCAGLDVHKEFVMAAIANTDRSTLKAEFYVKKFNTTNEDLLNMAQWLKGYGVMDVCMESTGKYWIPVFNNLEECRLKPVLVNPKYVKQIKGQKTDLRDVVFKFLPHIQQRFVFFDKI